jgi:protein TonB
MTAGAASPFEPRGVRFLRWSGAAVLVVAGHVCATALATINWQLDDPQDDAAGPVAIELAPMPLSPRRDTPDVAPGPLMEEAKLTPQPAKEVVKEVDLELPRVEPSPLAPEPEVVLPVRKPVEEEKPKTEVLPAEEVPTQRSEAQTVAAPLATAPPPIDAPRAPAAAAPDPGIAAAAARARASWEKALVSHLNRYKRYPRSARARGIRGDVRVRFTLDRTGQVTGATVVESSGYSALDDEALAVLRRASPMPAPPEQIGGAAFDMVLPIQFRIR